MRNIRNFCIIAHIDHGKSTLADRMLEITDTLSSRDMEAQVLDSMDLEKEKGITIKSHAIQMEYVHGGEKFILNLIDTPGHVDFSYEVSRAIASCEGALLVVDATQGIQAQTISNLYLAIEHNLEIIPVLNKIDMDAAMPDVVTDQVVDLLGCRPEDVLRASGKTGEGVREILDAIVERIPAPEGDPEAPLQALIFDSVFNSFRGIIAYFKVKNGSVKKGDKFVVRFYSPMETIGGGVILEPNPSVHRRFQQQVIEDLERKESGSTADVVEMHVRSHGETMITLSELAKLTALAPEEIARDVEELKKEGTVLTFPMRKDTYVWHRQAAARARERILEELAGYEAKYPYRYGMKKAQIHTAFFPKLKPNVFDSFINRLEEEQAIKRGDEFLSTPDYEVCKDTTYQQVSETLLGAMEKAGFDFVRYGEIPVKGVSQEVEDDILNILLEEKQIVKVTEEMYTLSSYMEQAKEKIREKLKEEPVITIAQVRDMFHTSRKSAKPILEYMDTVKVTRKTGAESERVAY